MSKIQLQTHLTSLCLSPMDTTTLLRLLESDVPIVDAKNLIAPILKRNDMHDMFYKAITELESVSRNAKIFGVDVSI